jgi:hypothetical protein
MKLDGIIAIDWSGAKIPKKSIQVAACYNGVGEVKLVCPPNSARSWARSTVYEWLTTQVASKRLLVGFDFAFAYPFRDKGAYFPSHRSSPATPKGLWQIIDETCNKAKDFYGGAFYKLPDAPFADYLQYQKYTGRRYQPRFRATECRARAMGLTPSSAFKCVGASVGVGSVAGMRFLHKLTRDDRMAIWPFVHNIAPGQSVVVEIFPQVFLQGSIDIPRGSSNRELVNLASSQFKLPISCGHNNTVTEDERDALVSAAGMFRLASEEWPWHPQDVSERILAKEGWIFGVR